MSITKIDLHVHSHMSDGTLSPSELVYEAKRASLSAFALTDHDTTDGINEAINAASHTNIEIIPGIELSCDYQGQEVHMVGLYIDPKNPILVNQTESFLCARDKRNQKMVSNLADAGFSITMENLIQSYPNSIITRAHMARYLYDTNQVRKMNVVFDKYIGNDAPYYVPREKITPFEAIELIHQANGLAILAHPILYHMNANRLDEFVKNLAASGLDGMECIYSTYTPGDTRNMKQLAEKYNLCISGGSDFHGSNKPAISLGSGTGNLFVPSSLLDIMKNRLNH